MANSISWGDATTTSFIVYANDLRTIYGDKEITWYLDGDPYDSYVLNSGIMSDSCEFNDLDPDTTYSVYYSIIYTDGGAYDEESSIIHPSTDTEEEDAERPEYFDWTYTKKSGNEFNLTAKEWNALCKNVNELLAYYGQYDYYFTTAYKEAAFTANMYNEILDAIYPISPRSWDYLKEYKVNPGDAVRAKALNDLVDLVNEC